jgi:hypothetical protein
MHPKYNSRTLANDVALLLFNSNLFEDGDNTISSVPMNDQAGTLLLSLPLSHFFLRVLFLPYPPSFPTALISVGRPCVTAGWGTTSSGGSTSCNLLKADIKYQSCQSLVQAKFKIAKGSPTSLYGKILRVSINNFPSSSLCLSLPHDLFISPFFLSLDCRDDLCRGCGQGLVSG